MAKLPDVDEWAREAGKKGAQYAIELLEQEYGVSAARLRELAEADREGRCVVLPCKIGDTLYRIQRFKRGKNWKKEAEFIRTVELNRNNFWRIVIDGELGETVFLTRAEAEAALRREQDD